MAKPSASPSQLPKRFADDAFAKLLADNRNRLLQFLRLCGAGQDAEDVLQETMERVWKYREHCARDRAPRAWLQQSAFHCWLDHRKRRLPQPIGDDDQLLAARSEEICTNREQLQAALAHMTDLERDILLRFHERGDTLSDIGKDLNMNVNTVKSHLHRARRRLPRGPQS